MLEERWTGLLAAGEERRREHSVGLLRVEMGPALSGRQTLPENVVCSVGQGKHGLLSHTLKFSY